MARSGNLALILAMGLAAGTLAGCETTAMTGDVADSPVPASYRLGDDSYTFDSGALLQTWPVIPYTQPPQFARLAVRLDVETLVPDLAGDTRPVQVDVLAASFIPDADQHLTASFSDWKSRENAPSQSAYKFLVTSQRGATGTRIAYLRMNQPRLGLDSLAPFQAQEGAPIYLVGLDGSHVTTLIECAPVPLPYGGGDYCSLRRAIDADHGYRVLFPLDLLPHWQAFDDAAHSYVNAASS